MSDFINNINKERVYMTLPKEGELLKKAALLEQKNTSQTVLAEYRTLIISLKTKKLSIKKISVFLKENGVDVSYQMLIKYLKNNPINDNELNIVKISFNEIEKEAIKEQENYITKIIKGEKDDR